MVRVMKPLTPAQYREHRDNDTRRHLASFIAEALRAAPCCQRSEGWAPATVTESVTTSGCPLITLTFAGSDGSFNVTITRARK